jgi:GntR family transcriptional regulator/MocR family aminotransferase
MRDARPRGSTSPLAPPGPRRAPLRFPLRPARGGRVPREIWRRLPPRTRAGLSDALGYGSPAGHGLLRAALSEYLGRARGVVCDPERIVVVNGTQQGST